MSTPGDLESTIRVLVESFRPAISKYRSVELPQHVMFPRYEGTALLLTVSLSADYPGSTNSGFERVVYAPKEARRVVDFLFIGDTHVFMAAGERGILDFKDVSWLNTSNHNSCWCTDGIREIYYSHELVTTQVQEHLPMAMHVPSRRVAIFHMISRVELVGLEFGKSLDERDGLFRVIAVTRNPLKAIGMVDRV